MSSEITALCCCGALDCTGWQNCRPLSFQISGNMVRQFGRIHTNQGTGFQIEKTVITLVFSATMTKYAVYPYGMVVTAGSFNYRSEKNTYYYHGTYQDPNCFECLTRYLHQKYVTTGAANSLAPFPAFGGASFPAGIKCFQPCGAEPAIFSVFQAGLSASFTNQQTTYYEFGSPSVSTFSGVQNLGLTLSGLAGCLTPASFNQYNLTLDDNNPLSICAEFPPENAYNCSPASLNPNGIFVDEGCESTICADDHFCYLSSPPRACGCVSVRPEDEFEPPDGSRNNNLGVLVEKSFIDMYSTVTATL